VVTEKQDSSEVQDKVVYDNALVALRFFSDDEHTRNRVEKALRDHCDPGVAEKAIRDLKERKKQERSRSRGLR
jgi:hypothetical protein